MSDDPALDYLMGGGVPSASFLEVGAVHRGRIRSYELQQQRDFATGNPKIFDNGDPMMQVCFTLETEERDTANEDDDGLRKVYAKGQMLDAVRQAIRKAKHKGSLVGGVLAVKYEANGEPSRVGFNAPKVYRVMFSAPDPMDALPEYDESETEPF